MPLARPQRRVRAAFTLVELLATIAVIAILAGITIGGLRSATQRAGIARAKAELAVITAALERFRERYGDYPQTGPSAANSHRVTGTSGPPLNSAQAILFNALTGAYGVFGPGGGQPGGGRINGPVLADVGKLRLEVPLTGAALATFAVATGSPPLKPLQANAFVDPWGNRYFYFYKRPSSPGGAPQTWLAPAYVLYSAGPDGAASLMPNAAGLFTGNTQTSGDNADNIYADTLP